MGALSPVVGGLFDMCMRSKRSRVEMEDGGQDGGRIGIGRPFCRVAHFP